MEEEKKYFEYVMKYINARLNEELDSFDELEYQYRRNPERYGVSYHLACHLIKTYKNGKDKPYFGRIDFCQKNNNKNEKYYIGKYGIEDSKLNYLVVDWRAPISSLYYDSELGEASYECPDGVIEGELQLKRQFEIENGELINYFDIDIVSNDELLQKYLNDNNDVRLKNIVSTIQKEQNTAIRKPLNRNIIVQGVAGSGKTTIALHRIAYLAYNYRNKIKNNQYLVIGPNNVFLKYISGVLPDLDVDGINQKIYEDLATDIIDDDEFKIKDSSKYLTKYLANKTNNDIPKFKSSLKFKDMLEKYIDDFFGTFCSTDLVIKGYKILEQKKLKSIFEVAISSSDNFEEAIERFVLLASNYIDRNKDEISKKFNEDTTEKFKNLKGDKKQYYSDKKIVHDEIEKNCKTSLRKYILKNKISPIKLYKKFINDIELYDIYNYEFLKQLKKETLENIKNNEFDFEDLAPLMYIRYRMGISNEEKKYRQVVVDEAQDFGEFNFYVLKKCLPNANFSIYGDITQSIYDYRSIDSWDEVAYILDDCEIIPFNKSYRTTDEIMEVANSIPELLDIEPSELSVRHGESVVFDNVDKDEIPAFIKQKIIEYKNNGYKTIAVISKYPLQSKYINEDLSFEGIFIPNIDESIDITNLEEHVVTIPNYLAKGLEFDAVIINNASEEIYNSTSQSDMKMLYVALTRSLHKLDIIYSGEITQPLKKYVEEKTYVKRK